MSINGDGQLLVIGKIINELFGNCSRDVKEIEYFILCPLNYVSDNVAREVTRVVRLQYVHLK